MPALTGLKIARWSLHSTVREAGFTVDQATIEYVEIDQATFLAIAQTFRFATQNDTVDLYVTVDGVETYLFRGIVIDWSLSEGPDGTTATLVAEDERGRLLDTVIPPGWVCRGMQYDFRFPANTLPQTRMLQAVQRLAALAGLTIDVSGAPDYALGPDLAPAPGTTVGQAIARLLQAYQQVRRKKLDLIRTGPTSYRLAVRPETLTGGISVPKAAVKVRRYRRSLMPPIEDATVIGATVPGTEFNTRTRALAARGCGTITPFDVIYPEDVVRLEAVRECVGFVNQDGTGAVTEQGQRCTTRIGDRTTLVEVSTDQFVPTFRHIDDRTIFAYDGAGRLTRVTNEKTIDGVLQHRVTKTVEYDPLGRISAEGTTTEELVSGAWMVQKLERIDKIPTNGATVKLLNRWDATGATSELDGIALEVSPGDARLADDPESKWFQVTLAGDFVYSHGRWWYRDQLLGEEAVATVIAADARNQANHWLDEVELEMPVDLRIGVHTVLDFGTDTIAGVQRFLVTEIAIEDGVALGMRVRAEAFTPAPAGAGARGASDSRGGFPTWPFGRRAAPEETLRFMHGMVTRNNGDGTAQVFVPEEGVVYPHVPIRGAANGRVVLPRDQVTVERRGLTLQIHP